MNSLKFECYLLLSVLILSLFGCDKEETVQGYYIKNLKGPLIPQHYSLTLFISA